jgi:hypothetical protein
MTNAERFSIRKPIYNKVASKQGGPARRMSLIQGSS